MTRRAGAVPEETRAALVAAARREFAEHGYSSASIRSICSAAGVTTGALYFFFRNKEELFEAVVSPLMERVTGLLGAHHRGELADGIVRRAADGGASVGRAEPGRLPCGELDDVGTAEALVRAVYRSRETAEIVVGNRDVPCVARFFDGVVSALDRQTEALLAQWDPRLPQAPSFGAGMVHWYSHQQVGVVLYALEHGLVSLDDRLGRWLGDVPQDKREITLLHLLTHTSGMSASFLLPNGREPLQFRIEDLDVLFNTHQG